MTCLDENVLTGFLQGVLAAADVDRVERHIDECSECRGLLSALSRLSLDRTLTRVTQPSEDAPPEMPEPGQIIAGKYRIERVIGAGGMGVVVAATHLELDQVVALKFMQPAVIGNPEASARFLREARAVARLKSEHVGRVLDFAKLDGGASYIVMEYLEGQDLDRLVAAQGPLPLDVATHYLLQAMEAVAEAHASGIIHRDLKPANLFLARAAGGAACVKVLDFGVSKYAETGTPIDLGKTDARAVIGSPLYMAPEQLLSAGTAGQQADLWSLGCTLYQLVSGKTPFVGATLPQVAAAIMKAAPRPLKDLVPEVPQAFEAAIARCLNKEPSHRFQDVAELAQALAPFAPTDAQEYVERIATVLGRTAPVESVPSAATTPHQQTTQQRRRDRVITVVAVAASLLLPVIAYLVMRDRAEPPVHAPQVAATPDKARDTVVVAVQQPTPTPAPPAPADPTPPVARPAPQTEAAQGRAEPKAAPHRSKTHAAKPAASANRSTTPQPPHADDVFGQRK